MFNDFVVVFFILDAPFCRPGQHRVYGVARHEEARISCDLDANPSNSLHFRWLFNSSAGVIELPASTWTAEGSRSVARYLPSSDLDFGSLLCSAHNSIGQQSVPCLYHVIPAGKCFLLLYLVPALANRIVRPTSMTLTNRPFFNNSSRAFLHLSYRPKMLSKVEDIFGTLTKTGSNCNSL